MLNGMSPSERIELAHVESGICIPHVSGGEPAAYKQAVGAAAYSPRKWG